MKGEEGERARGSDSVLSSSSSHRLSLFCAERILIGNPQCLIVLFLSPSELGLCGTCFNRKPPVCRRPLPLTVCSDGGVDVKVTRKTVAEMKQVVERVFSPKPAHGTGVISWCDHVMWM